MALGFNIGTEAGVRVQTPTRGLVVYLKEIVHPDYIDYGGETQIAGAWQAARAFCEAERRRVRPGKALS